MAGTVLKGLKGLFSVMAKNPKTTVVFGGGATVAAASQHETIEAEIEEIKKDPAKYAKELGTSTKEVATGAVDFVKDGGVKEKFDKALEFADGIEEKSKSAVNTVTNTYDDAVETLETAKETAETAKNTLDALNGTGGEGGWLSKLTGGIFDDMGLGAKAGVGATAVGGLFALSKMGMMGGAVKAGLLLSVVGIALHYVKENGNPFSTDNENNVASNKGFDNSDLVVPGMEPSMVQGMDLS